MLFDGLFILHSNTTGGTSAAGTAYPSGNPRVHPRIIVVFMLLNL